MATTAPEVLSKAEPGRALAVFCDDVALARRQVRAAAEAQVPMPTLVALEWERAPSLARELDEIRDGLAGAAASLWPDWYIGAEQRFERKRSPDVDIAVLLAEATQAPAHASPSWLREVWQRRREGRSLVLEHVSSAEQVRQLSRALDPSALIFVLSVTEPEAPTARLRGLARAGEWLAREAQAKTLLLVPAAWHGNPELDPVSYGAVRLAAEAIASDGAPAHGSERARRAPSDPPPEVRAPGRAVAGDGIRVLVGPVVGEPHPASEVEQRLHARLSADRELGSLFEYNQRLAAFGERHYIVDLVWRRGRLIVEIDGPEHRGQLAYQDDRDRDYRLCMSGYTTLRVTNDEVSVDVERVVDKIKNLVSRQRALAEERGSS